MPTLYVVATPIGNLEDMTFRAVRILKEVALIASEDTRTTAHLLSRYEIKTPLTSYFEHNKKAKLDYLLSKLDEGDLALVSEAGMPGYLRPRLRAGGGSRAAGHPRRAGARSLRLHLGAGCLRPAH